MTNEEHRSSPTHADFAPNPSSPERPTESSKSIETFEELRERLEDMSDAGVTHSTVRLLAEENSEIEKHLENDEYRTAAVRLNALFETYTQFGLRVEWRTELGRPLSRFENEYLKQLGHSRRLEKAGDESILGGHFKGALSALYQSRNPPAHVAWTDVDSDDIDSDVEHAHEKLGDHIQHLREEHLVGDM